jgi:hypothetical protein
MAGHGEEEEEKTRPDDTHLYLVLICKDPGGDAMHGRVAPALERGARQQASRRNKKGEGKKKEKRDEFAGEETSPTVYP